MLNHFLKENGDIPQGLEKLLEPGRNDVVRVGSLPWRQLPLLNNHEVVPGTSWQTRAEESVAAGGGDGQNTPPDHFMVHRALVNILPRLHSSSPQLPLLPAQQRRQRSVRKAPPSAAGQRSPHATGVWKGQVFKVKQALGDFVGGFQVLIRSRPTAPYIQKGSPKTGCPGPRSL